MYSVYSCRRQAATCDQATASPQGFRSPWVAGCAGPIAMADKRRCGGRAQVCPPWKDCSVYRVRRRLSSRVYARMQYRVGSLRIRDECKFRVLITVERASGKCLALAVARQFNHEDVPATLAGLFVGPGPPAHGLDPRPQRRSGRPWHSGPSAIAFAHRQVRRSRCDRRLEEGGWIPPLQHWRIGDWRGRCCRPVLWRSEAS